MLYKLGFIGAGEIVSAIVQGLLAKQIYKAEQMLVSCTSEKSGELFFKKNSVSYTLDNTEVLSQSSVIILGIKPQIFSQIIPNLSSLFRDKLVISLVAGVGLDCLQKLCGEKVVRLMPNTPAQIGKAVSVYSCSRKITGNQKEIVEEIFGSLGLVRRVEESQLDLITAVSASGPAFFFKYVEEMINSAVKLGLDKDLAFDLVTHTVSGALAMIEQKVDTPQNLRKAVTSPNGTTYAGLQKMSELSFEQLVFKTLQASKKRSLSLGEEIKNSIK